MKQETIEEAAENNWDKINHQYKEGLNPYAHRVGFKEGAKWQAERMYSEEDMKQFAEWLIKVNFNYTSNISDVFLIWEKQFKKK
jgi:methanogenic corrinoid protein MtbC1